MNNLYPIAFFDAPQVLQAYVTNIPGAASLPLQVVANIGFSAAYSIQFADSTGDWIGVYTGAVGQEVLRTIIGNGLSQIVPVVIPAQSRVSLRSMTASPITNGNLVVTFLGYKFSQISSGT